MPDEPSALLKPAHADVVVRDPITREPLPSDGACKPLDTYWCRRLADGDVVDAAAAIKPALTTVQRSPE